VGENAKKLEIDNTVVAELDAVFLAIVDSLLRDVIKHASGAAKRILNLSGEFLGETAQAALDDFHSLYFATDTLDDTKQKVNTDVDNMFDEIKQGVEDGKSSEQLAEEISEDDESKRARLALSGLQKQLESIVSLDKGIREKLVPVLSSMQFEDLITHRLSHIINSWELVTNSLGNQDISFDPAEVGQQIADMLTSQEERASYYKIVLKTVPPKGIDDSELWFNL